MNSNTTKIYLLGAKVDRVLEQSFLQKIIKFFKNKALSLVISLESKLVTSCAWRWVGR